MSRFWAAGAANVSDSDSDADSDNSSSNSSSNNSDNESDDDSSSDDNNNNANEKNAASGENRWLAFSDDEDSSDDDDVRIVKSGKDRAFEFFQKQIGSLYRAMKARDYYAIQTLFDDLMKAMIKAKQYLKTGVPRPLVRILVDLENYINERLQDKEQFKVISARQSRAVNRMKLTLKKHNVAYKVVMDAYRENPDTDDLLADDDDDDDEDKENAADDDDSSSSSSSSSDSDLKKKKKDVKPVDSDDSDSVRNSVSFEKDRVCVCLSITVCMLLSQGCYCLPLWNEFLVSDFNLLLWHRCQSDLSKRLNETTKFNE
jgi:translation initiation factor 3 subunit C